MSALFEKFHLVHLYKPFLLSKSAPKIRIDDWSFRIHYRLTALLFLLCSGLVSMKEFVGDHIKCVHMQEDDSNAPLIPKKVLETYCYVTTTFTVPYDPETSLYKMDYHTAQTLGGPGYIPGRNERVFHAYYQWVAYYLFFVAIIFATPHALWKSVDGNKIPKLVQDLNVPELPTGKSVKGKQVSMLANYLVKSKGQHFFWGSSFILCELLNLVALAGCMYLTDLFLGHEFSTYGPQVVQFLEHDPEDRMDPMSLVFPLVTKCNLNTYGPSGSVQNFDALCILPLNIINEKIFTFLWFWLAGVLVISVGALLYRIMTLLFLPVRCQALGIDTRATDRRARDVLKHFSRMDWILLYLLRQNMDQITFDKLIYDIDEQL